MNSEGVGTQSIIAHELGHNGQKKGDPDHDKTKGGIMNEAVGNDNVKFTKAQCDGLREKAKK